MIRLLNILSILVFTTGIILSFTCINNFMNYSEEPTATTQKADILQKFKTIEMRVKVPNNEMTHPLVSVAQEYASHLNPPVPIEYKERSRANPTTKLNYISQILPETTPKFLLIATSYNNLKPQQSLALISEPGKGSYWVKSGEMLGHFIIESIEHKAIVFRNGSSLQRVTIDSQVIPIYENPRESNLTAQIPTKALKASTVENNPTRAVNIQKTNTKKNKSFQKLRPKSSQI